MIIVLLSMMSIYKIQETYIKGSQSIEEYRKTIEKPVITVEWAKTSGDKITLKITNQGPSPVLVKRIYLYKQDSMGTPVSLTPADTRDDYLPVGDSLQVDFVVDNLVDYIFWNKPLRILLETDRGLVVASYKTVIGRAYVNIHLPTWVQTEGDASRLLGGLRLVVETPSNGGVESEEIPLTSALTHACPSLESWEGLEGVPYSHYACHDGGLGNVIVALTLPSSIQYTFKLVGTVSIPALMQSESHSGSEAGFAYTKRMISYESKATVPPEGAAQVSFFLPDATWLDKKFEKPHQPALNGYTLDFSWMFKPHGDTYGSTGVSGGGSTYHGDDVWRGLYRVASRVIGTGTVTGYSPAGCQVYPPPTTSGEPPNPPSDIVDEIKLAIDTEWSNDASHAGVPILVYSPSGSCPNYGDSGTREILQVIVRMEMNEGHFMVIPVFTWDDKDGGNDMPVTITIENHGGHGGQGPITVYEDENEAGWRGGSTEFAVPIDAGYFKQGDVLTLTFHVKVSSLSDPVLGMLVLSKLIVVPVVNPTQACIFQPSSELSFPWDIVNLTTGRTEGNSNYLYFLLNPYIPSSDDPSSLYSRAVFTNSLEASNTGSVTRVRLDNANDPSILRGVSRIGSDFTLTIGTIGSGDGSLLHDSGLLGVYNPDLDVYRTPATLAHLEYSVFSSLHGSGYPVAVAGTYSGSLSTNSKQVVVTLTMRMPSDRGRYAVIVPYRFISSSGGYLENPSVTSSPSFNKYSSGYGDGAGILVIQASRNSMVSITFKLGLPEADGNPITKVTVGLGIGAIAVVREPANLLGHIPSNAGGKNPAYGIIVANVSKISKLDPRLVIYDRVTGEQLANILLNEGDNVVSFRWLDWYRNAEFYTYPIHSLYLMIVNAKCPTT